MSKTEYLNLNLTPDVTDESFVQWRNSIDGEENSNMAIIDDKFGKVDSSIQDRYNGNESDELCLPKDKVDGVSVQTKFTVDSDAINYQIWGNSYQDTRSGKNLFDINTTKKGYGDVSIDINNNVMTLTATNTIGAQYIKNFVYRCDSTKTYTFSCKAKKMVKGIDGVPNIKVNIYGSNNDIDYTTIATLGVNDLIENKIYDFNYSFNGYSIYRFYFYNNSHTPVTIGEQTQYWDIQLETGTTVTPYEQYGAMPSPEFPSEIQSVGDLVTDGEYAGKYRVGVKVYGKNIIDFEDALRYWNIDYTIDTSTNEYVFNSIRDAYKKPYRLQNGTGEYTLTGLIKYTDVINPRFAFAYISDDGTIKRYYTPSLPTVETVTMKNVNAIYLDYSSIQGRYQWRIKNVQVEKGQVDTPYEPYREETVNIYLNEPLRKIGDYVDYIDFKRGKVVRNICEDICNGTERWIYSLSELNRFSYVRIRNKGIGKQKTAILNKFSFSELISYGKFNQNISTPRLNVYYDLDNIDDWNLLLSKWYNEGNPLIIDYVLATPVEEPINLQPLHLQDGINNIIAETTTQPSNIIVEYYQNITDRINELINAIITQQIVNINVD